MSVKEDDAAVFYWRTVDTDIDIRVDGYVGISTDFETRKQDHQRWHLKTYGTPCRVTIVASGTLREMRILENKYRPKRDIGQNRDMGGGRDRRLLSEKKSQPTFFNWDDQRTNKQDKKD